MSLHLNELNEGNTILIIANGPSVNEFQFGELINKFPLIARINNYTTIIVQFTQNFCIIIPFVINMFFISINNVKYGDYEKNIYGF